MNDILHHAGSSPARPLRIAVRLFDEREGWHLSRTLEMAARLAGLVIEMGVAAESADVIFVAPEDAGADALLNRDAAVMTPLVVAYAGQPLPGVLHLARPARLQPSRELLAQVALQAGPALPARPSAVPRASLPFAVATLGPLLEAVLAARFSGDALRVHHGDDEFLFLPRQHKVLSRRRAHLEALADTLLDCHVGDIAVLDAAQAAAAAAVEAHVVPFDALVWQLAMLAAPRLAAADAADVHHLRLKRLPNFAILPHRACHLQWAALLVDAAQPLESLLAKSPGGLDPVARFANACCLMGLLESGAALAAPARARGGALLAEAVE